MDNETMVEAFKFLDYYQLAMNSLASKRFWDLIQTHRHSLVLLDVDICMYGYVANQEPAVINICNKDLSAEEYNELIVRNGYSKQIPLECQIAGKENTENVRDIYQFRAYRNPNNCHDIATTLFYAQVEIKDENWPVVQHFFRLFMDPFIYIRSLELFSLKALSLLVGAMSHYHDRLQCINSSHYDEELFDFFMTGAPCTNTIYVKRFNLSKVFDLVQKFKSLKNAEEYQVVESIWGYVKHQADVEEMKRNCAEFIAKQEKSDQQHEHGRSTRHVVEFINKDIGKKLTLEVTIYSFALGSFSIKSTIL